MPPGSPLTGPRDPRGDYSGPRRPEQTEPTRLFIYTLLLYLGGTALTAFVTGHYTGWLLFFYATWFVAGMGIGGQYAAINSAIDEMMPSKYRAGWTSGSTGATGPARSSARSSTTSS
jgi:MFS family permease